MRRHPQRRQQGGELLLRVALRLIELSHIGVDPILSVLSLRRTGLAQHGEISGVGPSPTVA